MKDSFSYISVADSIYKDFIEDKLDVGDILPTEQDLIEYYNKSRTTIHRGIEILVEKNLVYTVRGSGTFVKGEKQDFTRSKLGFCEYAKKMGAIPKTDVLEMNVRTAPTEIVKILQLTEGDLIYKIKRLRYLNDIPHQVEVSFLPVALFPNLNIDVLSGSKYHYIEKIQKMKIRNSRLVIEPVLLDADTAQLLRTEPNILALSIKGTSFLKDGTIFEYTEMIENSNKYNLIFDIIK